MVRRYHVDRIDVLMYRPVTDADSYTGGDCWWWSHSSVTEIAVVKCSPRVYRHAKHDVYPVTNLHMVKGWERGGEGE